MYLHHQKFYTFILSHSKFYFTFWII